MWDSRPRLSGKMTAEGGCPTGKKLLGLFSRPASGAVAPVPRVSAPSRQVGVALYQSYEDHLHAFARTRHDDRHPRLMPLPPGEMVKVVYFELSSTPDWLLTPDLDEARMLICPPLANGFFPLTVSVTVFFDLL